MTLHGPAHPEEFRVQVGRYGERFYHDPLPADERWSATDETWPSVTTIKKASDRDWSWVSLQRAADYLFERASELEGLNAGEIHSRLLEVNKAGLGRAASRGTATHHVAEMIAAGQTWLPGTLGPAEEHAPALQKFFDDCQPEFIASEIVCLHRGNHDGMGYGGTCDAVVKLNGDLYVVDWKTRRPGKHAAYPEEAMQLAAYRHCQYVIVDDDGIAVRQPFPEVAGGLVVSITPEGYRLFPVDLDEAWQAFQTLRAWWSDKQRPMVGKAIVMGGVKGGTAEHRDVGDLDLRGRDNVLERSDRRTPGRPGDGDIPVSGGSDAVGDDLGGSIRQADRPVDEGDPLDTADIDALIDHLHQLQTDHAGVGDLFKRWSREALDTGGDIRLRVKDGDGWRHYATVRRFELGRAMLRCVEYVVANPRRPSAFSSLGDMADAVMRALIDRALGEEQQTTFTIGRLLGSLGWDDASELARLADLIDRDDYKLTRKGGRLIVKVA